MTAEESRIYEKHLLKMKFNDKGFSFEKMLHIDVYTSVMDELDELTRDVRCDSYMFIFILTKYREKHGDSVVRVMWEILDQYISFPTKTVRKDVAFAAFYYLGLHFSRKFDTESFNKLLSCEPYFNRFFADYPLFFELSARYFGLVAQYDRQVLTALCALKKMEKVKCENVAVKISFVAAICMRLQSLYIEGVKELIDGGQTSSANSISAIALKEYFKDTDETQIQGRVCRDYVERAIEYTRQALDFNPRYSKYHYLMAQLKFFSSISGGNMPDKSLHKEICDMIETAISFENSLADDYGLRVAEYRIFLDLVENHFRGNMSGLAFARHKDSISRIKDIKNVTRPKNNYVDGEDYVFISYSTKNFRQVYIDLLEMKRRGISYWYDGGVDSDEAWYKSVQKYIQNCSCVICYLSNEYMTSDSIEREMKLIRRFRKPVFCINCTDNNQISEIIADAYKYDLFTKNERLTSEKMRLLVEIFNDTKNSLRRSHNPAVTAHIDRLYGELLRKYPRTVRFVKAEGFTMANNTGAKQIGYIRPNEDAFCIKENEKVYAVADGISRCKSEYTGNGGSIAAEISQMFTERMCQRLSEGAILGDALESAEDALRDAFIAVNREIGEYIEQNKHRCDPKFEKAGCVGVVAFIYNDKLIYGGIGDCMGLLVRRGQTLVFSQKHTQYAFEHLGIENNRPLLYSDYVNKADNEYGYGVINGDEGAVDCLKISYIDIKSGDVIYLASDGVSDYLQYSNGARINKQTAEEIFEQSTEMDELTGKRYSDDKTFIKLTIGQTE